MSLWLAGLLAARSRESGNEPGDALKGSHRGWLKRGETCLAERQGMRMGMIPNYKPSGIPGFIPTSLLSTSKLFCVVGSAARNPCSNWHARCVQ